MAPRRKIDLDTILQVSIKIADEEGIHAVTMATLAKKLTIRPPSLYNHIDGLPELRKKLAIVGFTRLYIMMKEQTADISGDEAIIALSKAYVAFVRLHPGLYEATLLDAANQDSEVKHAGEKIVSTVLEALGNYNLGEQESIHAVRALRSILHGFASIEKNNGFGMPIDLDESLDYMVLKLLLGIKKSG